MVEPDFDKEPAPKAQTEDEIQKSFTSWKLEMINAMSMDRLMTPGEFRVACRLIQHANAKTQLIFPSQESIADQVGMNIRQVRKYVRRICDKGWLHKTRYNRHSTNQYRFNEQHVEAILDRQNSLREDRNEKRAKRLGEQKIKSSDRSNAPSQDSPTGSKGPVGTGSKGPVGTGSNEPLNTLREHLKGTPEEVRGMEQGNSNGDTREAETQREVNSDDR